MHKLKPTNTAILVSLDFGNGDYTDRLQELQQLTISANLQTLAVIEGKRSRPDPTSCNRREQPPVYEVIRE